MLQADGTLCFGKKKWEMAADRYGYGLQQLDEINSEVCAPSAPSASASAAV